MLCSLAIQTAKTLQAATDIMHSNMQKLQVECRGSLQNIVINQAARCIALYLHVYAKSVLPKSALILPRILSYAECTTVCSDSRKQKHSIWKAGTAGSKQKYNFNATQHDCSAQHVLQTSFSHSASDTMCQQLKALAQ